MNCCATCQNRYCEDVGAGTRCSLRNIPLRREHRKYPACCAINSTVRDVILYARCITKWPKHVTASNCIITWRISSRILSHRQGDTRLARLRRCSLRPILCYRDVVGFIRNHVAGFENVLAKIFPSWMLILKVIDSPSIEIVLWFFPADILISYHHVIG